MFYIINSKTANTAKGKTTGLTTMGISSQDKLYFSPQVLSGAALLRVKKEDGKPDMPFTFRINDFVSFSLDGKYFVVHPNFNETSLEKLNIDVTPLEDKPVKIEQRWTGRDWEVKSKSNYVYVNSLLENEDYILADVGEKILLKQRWDKGGYAITKNQALVHIDDLDGNKCFEISSFKGQVKILDIKNTRSYFINYSPSQIKLYEYCSRSKFENIGEVINYQDKVEARNYKEKRIYDITVSGKSIKIDERFSAQKDYMVTEEDDKILVDQIWGNNDYYIATLG